MQIGRIFTGLKEVHVDFDHWARGDRHVVDEDASRCVHRRLRVAHHARYAGTPELVRVTLVWEAVVRNATIRNRVQRGADNLASTDPNVCVVVVIFFRAFWKLSACLEKVGTVNRSPVLEHFEPVVWSRLQFNVGNFATDALVVFFNVVAARTVGEDLFNRVAVEAVKVTQVAELAAGKNVATEQTMKVFVRCRVRVWIYVEN